MFLHRLGKVKAPEFPKGLEWLNSDPLTMKRLLGKVVLIDFWTYSCINCIRTMPHLKRWNEIYAKHGLQIIGVHTPEFEFEKSFDNVEKAIADFKIKYPIVLDNDYKIWNLYTNRWWPRKFLIDSNGAIVYDHVGEGGYAQTEVAIQEALSTIGMKDRPAIPPDERFGGGICYQTTPETYLGYVRGRYGNTGGVVPNTEHAFSDIEDRKDELVYLHGHWELGPESVSHTRNLPAATEYLAIKYSAFSVNLVVKSLNSKTSKIEVELDGQPLPEDMAGQDVTIEKDGKAILSINQARMYRLVDSDSYHYGTLKLKTASSNLELFAFTFGSCKEV
ncbi:MAG: redoxin domain-containing protein [Candidatus Uhrbacteria bacterium]|nr:redoxin domain-containing protein [Candidatus Uhrbacteria bacterium]